jgi:hypothetical protein
MLPEEPERLKCSEVFLGVGEISILKKDVLFHLIVENYCTLVRPGREGRNF